MVRADDLVAIRTVAGVQDTPPEDAVKGVAELVATRAADEVASPD